MSDEIRHTFIEDGNYIVFEDGRIFKRLDPPASSGGYRFVRIGKKSYPLHRVIASAFIPNPENKPEVNHIDGNKSNNAVSNLEWVTRKENAIHAGEHGLYARNKQGERSDAPRQFPRSKALQKAAEEIEKNQASKDSATETINKIRLCRMRAGVTQTELAYALGVNQGAISQWETGAAQPTLDNLRKAAIVLGCNPGDLF